MNTGKTLLICSFFLLLFFSVPRVHGQTGEKSAVETSREMAGYFPESTVALGIIPDVPTLKNKLTSHRLMKALENKQIRTFFQPLLDKKKKKQLTDEKIRNVTGKSLDQLTEMMTGPAVMGIMEGKKGLFVEKEGNIQLNPPENVQGLFICEVGSNSETLAGSVIPSLIDKSKEKMREKNTGELYEKTESMGEHTLHTLLKQSDNNTQPLVSWTFVDGYLAIVSPESQTLLKRTVRKFQRGTDGSSVVRSPNFTKTVQKANDAELLLYADVEKIVDAGYEKAAQQQNSGGKQRGPSPEDAMNAFGLDTFRSAAGMVNLEKSFTEMSAELSYSERKGLTDILAFESISRDRKELLSLPPSTVSASATGFSINKFWERALQTFKQLNPKMSNIIDMQLNQLKKKYGIDLKKDIVNSLGNRIVTANFPPSENAGQENGSGTGSRQLWAIEVRDQQRLTGAINSLKEAVEQGKEYISERQYLGTTVYSVKPSILPGNTDGNINPSYAFVDGYLVISWNEEPLEDTIAHGKRGNRNGFFEQDKVQQSLDRLPAGSASFSYTNLKNVTSFLMDQIKSGAGVPLGATPGGNSIEEYINPDASLSPDTIEKFVQSVVGALYMNDQRSRMIWRLQHE